MLQGENPPQQQVGAELFRAKLKHLLQQCDRLRNALDARGLTGYVVADTSYGYTNNCRYLGGLQRIDIPVVQNWLAGFGVDHA